MDYGDYGDEEEGEEYEEAYAQEIEDDAPINMVSQMIPTESFESNVTYRTPTLSTSSLRRSERRIRRAKVGHRRKTWWRI